MSAMTKTDCFAYSESRCKALKRRYCDYERCNFYKKGTEEMKRPKKLTRAQKIFLSGKKLRPENWLLIEENMNALIIYNKNTEKVREARK